MTLVRCRCISITYDRIVKLPEENKTVGIVLCRGKSQTLGEITLPEDRRTNLCQPLPYRITR